MAKQLKKAKSERKMSGHGWKLGDRAAFVWSNHWHPQRDSNPCFRLERAIWGALLPARIW
jgi:hypothetical protein